MKLELKHLAPYLPFKLELQVAGEYIDDLESNGFRKWTMVGIVDNEIITHKEGYIANIENEIEDCFPILRPLSDVTFEDLEKLGGRYDIQVECGVGYLFRDIDGNTNPLEWRYDDVQYLLLKHFDIYGLIESGNAVDKNTVK